MRNWQRLSLKNLGTILARSPAQLSVNGHELQVLSTYQPCADKSSVQIRTGL
jgi:hypothetical protein